MATDDFRGGRMPGGGPAPRSAASGQSTSWPSEPPDLARQIGRLEARLKSIADGGPLPGGDHAVDAAIDDAVSQLANDLRKSSTAAASAKSRFDFRMPAARRDDLHDRAPPYQSASRPAEPVAYALATPESVESQFEAIRQRMSEFAGEPATRTARSAPAPEESDSTLPLAGADYLDVIERMQALAQAVPDRNRIERLSESVSRLGDVMSGSGHISVLASIESRVARLSEEIQALTERPTTDAELHARLADIRSLVIATNAADKGVARLESQFAAIAERIEAALARVPRADAIVAIANRLDAVTGRLDQIGANLHKPSPAIEGLAREMALIRREISEGNSRLDPAALDAQFAALAKRFDAMARVGGGASFGPLEAQIQRLTEKVEEGFARRAPVQVTPPEMRGPARATTTTGPKTSDNPLVDALKEDLSRLSGAPPAAPQPANPAAAAATLNAAMESFVRRLATVEAQTRQTAQAPAPARQRPDIEAEEDRRPLEPGSGRPGRQGRDTRKSEFVAAARRAAQAAAAETPAGERYEPRARSARRQQKQPGAFARLGGTIRQRQRVLLATAAAIALLAVGSLQAIQMLRPTAGRSTIAVTEATTPTPGTKTDGATVSATVDPGVDTATTATEGSGDRFEAATSSTPDTFDSHLLAPEGADHFSPAAEPTSTITIPDTEDAPTLKIPDTAAPAAAATTTSPAPSTKDATRPATAPQSLKIVPPPDSVGTPGLRTAAASGDPAALFEVGARYAEGRGTKPDPAAAAKWYGMAAERGLAVAQFRYASLNERGEGVPQDRKAAAEWYRRAAEQGNVRAMHNLAVMLSEGVGGPPDFSGAARWFSRAGDFGVKDSQYNLGVMYARGLGGVQDLAQSYKWFAIAAQQGDADATGRRDEVAKTLSPDQLAQAQAAVMSWRADTPPEKANTPPSPEEWIGVPSPLSSLDRTGLIKLIQERLTDRGFDPGPADGQPGPMTRDAVIAFQRQSGLPATGEMGPDLLAALDLPSR